MNIFSRVMLSILCILPLSSAWAADKYVIDKSHTTILFYINHLDFSDMIGRFDDFDATLDLNEAKPEESVLDVTVRPSGINTPSTVLNAKLQGITWFNSAQYPEIRFVSKEIKMIDNKTAKVVGELTMLGVTKPVTMNATLNKVGYFDMANAWIAGFSGEMTIKRSEFGLSEGVPLVGDEVRIVISTEFRNEARPAPTSAE